jgi:hypothetical protein
VHLCSYRGAVPALTRIPVRVPAVLALTCGLVLLAGCSKSAPKASSTGPSTSTASSTGSTDASTTSSSAAASVTAVPTPTSAPSLGGTCDDLLPLFTIDGALGRPVVGTTAFVVGVQEPTIGRLARLNCRYGVVKAAKGKPAPPPQVEISISLYDTAARATSRSQATIADYESHGARPTNTIVGQFPATVLSGYGPPTIVVAAGPRTIAVSVVLALVPVGGPARLASLAKAALDSTNHFNQGGPIAVPASPSASASASATS